MLALAAAIALVLPAPEPVAIQHVSVVNVVNGRIQKDVTVLLTYGTITATGRKIPVVKTCRTNPLEDIHNTTRIAAVFVRGRCLDRTTLDQMLKHKSDSAALPSRQRWGLDNGD
ncbi:MAG: hypothetical protein ABSA69_07560 [Verrucomicrobiota bacterium]|jgi:hypothetical protein